MHQSTLLVFKPRHPHQERHRHPHSPFEPTAPRQKPDPATATAIVRPGGVHLTDELIDDHVQSPQLRLGTNASAHGRSTDGSVAKESGEDRDEGVGRGAWWSWDKW